MPTYTLSNLPPSVNAMYRNMPGRGRVMTGEYQRWLKGAMSELMAQRRIPVVGAYHIEIVFSQKLRHRLSDLDNRYKGASDLLVKCELIEDDSLASKITMSWGESIGTTITVTGV